MTITFSCKDKTTKDPFRDVKYARIWYTDCVDDDSIKSDYNIQKELCTWNCVCVVK